MSTPTTPTGLTASDVTASSLTLSWSKARNPGTSMLSGPASGAWFGWGTNGVNIRSTCRRERIRSTCRLLPGWLSTERSGEAELPHLR